MDEVGIDFKIMLDELKRDVNSIKKELGGISDSVDKESSKMSGAIKRVGGAMLAYMTFDSAKELIGDIQNLRAEFEKYEAVLTNSLGSNKAALEVMDNIQAFAAKTPFQVSELTDAYVKYVNQGFKPTMAEMTNLGDLAASLGKDFDQLTEAVLDAQQGENERLKEFGIKASKNGDKIKYTFKGVTTEVQSNAESIRNYLLSLGKLDGVSGSMAAISKTLGGAMSNAKDSTDKLYNAIGQKLSPSLMGLYGNYSKIVSKLADWVEGSPAEEIEKERNHVNALVFELSSAELPLKRRNEIYEELKEIAPEVVESLDKEKLNYKKLNENLKTYNDLAIQRIALKKVEIELENRRSELADLYNNKREREMELFEEISKSTKYRNIMLDETLTKEEKLAKVMEDVEKKALARGQKGSRVSTSFGTTTVTTNTDPLLDDVRKFRAATEEYDSLYKELLEAQEKYQKELEKAIKKGLVQDSGEDAGKKVKKVQTDTFKQWKENLKKQEQAYKEYEAIKSNISKEEADKLYAELLKKAATYKEYLEKLLTKPLSKEKTAYVALELSPLQKKKTKVEKAPQEKAKSYYDTLLEETESYEEKLGEVYLKWHKDRMLLEKNGQKERVAILKDATLQQIEGIKREYGQYNWLYKNLEQLSRKELKLQMAKIKEELEQTEMSTEKKLELLERLQEAEVEMGLKKADAFYNASVILDGMVGIAESFNSELASALAKASELASSTANLIQGLSSGNYIQAAASALQIIGTIMESFEDNGEAYANKIQLQNKRLERQIKLMRELSGVSKTSEIETIMAELHAQEEDLLKKLQSTEWETYLKWDGSGWRQWSGDFEGKTVDEIRKYLELVSSKGYSIKKLGDIENLISQYDKVIDKQKELFDEWNEYITGTTSDNILSGIVSGLKESKKSVADFGEDFKNVIRSSMSQALMASLDESVDAFYEKYAELAKDGLTEAETTQLKKLYDSIVAEGIKKRKELEKIGISFSDIEENEEEISYTLNLKDEVTEMFNQIQMAGGDFIESFGKGFSGTIKKALLENFKERQVIETMKGFYEEFDSLNEDGLTPKEVETLRTKYMDVMGGLQESWEDMVTLFPDLFAQPKDNAQSTVGSVQNIQEPTANIMAGHLGNMRVDLGELVNSASQHLAVLNRMDAKLGKIEKHTKETVEALKNS
jgi:hypothetical protein